MFTANFFNIVKAHSFSIRTFEIRILLLFYWLYQCLSLASVCQVRTEPVKENSVDWKPIFQNAQ